MKFAIPVLGILFMALPTHATIANAYIAQTAQGAGTGADCADSLPVAFFNAAANWGKGTNQIGPGTTVHLCGTLSAAPGTTGYLNFLGSGISGSPITLKFETGAVLTAPYWGAGAITCNGQSYITINGGTNGTITATSNGTGLANQQTVSQGVYANGCSNLQVENLTISDMYVHLASPNDTNGGTGNITTSSAGIIINSGNSVTINNNTINDAWVCIGFNYPGGTTLSNLSIYGNTVSNCNWHLQVGDGNSNAIINTVLIYNNHLSGFTNWYTSGCPSACTFHGDGIFTFATHSGSQINGLVIYNNMVTDTSTSAPNSNTAFLYISADSGGGYGTINNAYVFNNVFYNPGAGLVGDGLIYDWGNGTKYYNNTSIYNTNSGGGPDNFIAYGSGAGSSANPTTVNNIFLGGAANLGFPVSEAEPLLSASNYNVLYNGSSVSFYEGTYYSTLSGWQAAYGFDANSINSNPKLNAGYAPSPGSPVIGAGQNLYSVCNGQPNPGVGALCYDAAGNARPSSGAWTIGAFQSSTSANAPAPPTGLTAIVH